jgi:hypothetical protein
MLPNRPLLCSITISKNDGALTTIQRDETYTSTELFVADMLTLYKNSFLINSNAVCNVKDGVVKWRLSHSLGCCRILMSTGNAATDPSISRLSTFM